MSEIILQNGCRPITLFSWQEVLQKMRVLFYYGPYQDIFFFFFGSRRMGKVSDVNDLDLFSSHKSSWAKKENLLRQIKKQLPVNLTEEDIDILSKPKACSKLFRHVAD